METKIFLSGKTLNQAILADTLCKHGIASNVYTMSSVVFNKAEQVSQVEQGAEVRAFDIPDNKQLFNAYNGLVNSLGINCLWIEQGTYKGCVTQMTGYAEHCKKHNQPVKTCSMY